MSTYAPPTVPLSVTWEGTEAYTPPTVPLGVSWEGSGEDTATATGTIVFGASANASVLTGASATGAIVVTGAASASALLSASAAAHIQFAATAEADVARFPAQVTGIAFIPTASTLAFAWNASAHADAYNVRLYLEMVLVEAKLGVEALEATFTGLDDGTTYVVEIQGINDLGTGPSGTREARTDYVLPQAPTNLRVLQNGFVLLQVAWDAPATKTTFYNSKIVWEQEESSIILYNETLPAEPTEAYYTFPMAATEYKWMLRAGNPAGLSEWVEFTLETASNLCGGPDSRGAIPPAAYQEDYLFPDTWDGGTDLISEGVGDPQDIYGGVEFFRGERRADRYQSNGKLDYAIKWVQAATRIAQLEYSDNLPNYRHQSLIDFAITADATVGTAFVESSQEAGPSLIDFAITSEVDIVVKMYIHEDRPNDALIDFVITASAVIGEEE